MVSLGFADVSALVSGFVEESDFIESDFMPVSALALVSDEAGALVLGEAAGLPLDGAADVLASTPSLADVSASRRPVDFRPCFSW